MTNKKNLKLGGALIGLIGIGLAFPVYFVMSKKKELKDPNSAYSRNASIRGTFLNSGSKDIGKSDVKLIGVNNNNNKE
ncbi:hypothetical protein DFA_02547 [Cavenderia fasciculata]|uniref:Transmembrane protein n=1 Tax=Cavenderia fasciculata TaxID=261658 RepID=F4PZP4_CACFS|nr:uncharacterized protein DFA_02547 [Cavenderia fasciculata]EGG18808.1 hypothetical protein DFA_02547 [Cavenderia fasciculata]|eukprot:XP_004357270.1 hypothetical protein DFA_02547 [Cavenderia fasciculata]